MENWKDVPGYENFYQVSDLGRVKSLSRKLLNRYGFYRTKDKILTPKKNKSGYYFVKFCVGNHKTFAVHRLVMLTFVGHSDLDVNHKDFDKSNNTLNNLEYCTRKQNVYHFELHAKRYSKYIGVSYDKHRKKWCAKYKLNKKTINLGRFAKEEEAYNAVKKYIDAPERLSN